MYKTRLFIYLIIYKYILLVTKLLLKYRNLVILHHSVESCERKYLYVCVFEISNEKKNNEMFSYISEWIRE
jgi:hypothetical protein